jgi:serine phosphatase RsbU (regulator of sigma subunit)
MYLERDEQMQDISDEQLHCFVDMLQRSIFLAGRQNKHIRHTASLEDGAYHSYNSEVCGEACSYEYLVEEGIHITKIDGVVVAQQPRKYYQQMLEQEEKRLHEDQARLQLAMQEVAKRILSRGATNLEFQAESSIETSPLGKSEPTRQSQ